MTTLSAGKLWGLRRLADAKGRFKMLAVDQRPPIKNPIMTIRGTAEAPYEDVAGFKLMLVEELQAETSAVLMDPHFALPRGLSVASPAKGMVVTLEDSIFRETATGRLSDEIDDWSVEKIKRAGGDAVKVLAWYRPDADPANCRAQEDFAKRIGEACQAYDIPYLFELLVYPLPGEAEQTKDYVEMAAKQADNVLESVRRFADPAFGIDIFKLESPVPAKGIGEGTDAATQKLFDEMGRIAGRPWVMLSAGAGMAEFEAVLKHAYAAGASGYLAGRAIWSEPFKAFPDWDGIRSGLRQTSLPYVKRINALTDQSATPWFETPLYGGKAGIAHADASFRHSYAGMGGA
ncbi:tagatose 1,6-diphosphate aldolase [Mesorhizobium sp. YIM 152430]|uniref:tagatose 1,6-diphosphate aldolase n=1 Tax=Mesorhizobium sp. YIM 152430 TaxID=3031761 RepID=UPI0023DA24C3|nr:tagatose 1,6-diphosphate aldolase [Mesorhizobium sp. YIM 152430]MDF1598460.1 tagatose 1,6-diphosphate aldolase [Mesorhizobium sp. YIM 152430]